LRGFVEEPVAHALASLMNVVLAKKEIKSIWVRVANKVDGSITVRINVKHSLSLSLHVQVDNQAKVNHLLFAPTSTCAQLRFRLGKRWFVVICAFCGFWIRCNSTIDYRRRRRLLISSDASSSLSFGLASHSSSSIAVRASQACSFARQLSKNNKYFQSNANKRRQKTNVALIVDLNRVARTKMATELDSPVHFRTKKKEEEKEKRCRNGADDDEADRQDNRIDGILICCQDDRIDARSERKRKSSKSETSDDHQSPNLD
jgi:hypothetical protein